MKASAPSLLSNKTISPRERLILALDVPTGDDAKRLVTELGDSVLFYKLGLQVFMSGDYFPLIKWLHQQDKNVFVDLKFFDVPETVKSAVAQLRQHQVSFATVHGNEGMLRAAIEEKNGIKILAVTVLTSLDRTDLQDLGFKCDVETLVLSRARRALEVGCDGVISSGLEAEKLRTELGDNLLIVVPGIRPVDNRREDDQKRVVTLRDAFLKGADYVVIGRPIRNAPQPRREAERLQAEIVELFGA